MEIVFVTPEITPYSGSGEIGDVCAALPKALRSIGHKVIVISPLWSDSDPTARGLARRLSGVEVSLGSARHTCTLHDGRTTGGVELVFVGQADLFGDEKRANAAGQLDAALVFVQAATQVLLARTPLPDVVHAHAWFAAAALPLVMQALPQAARVLSLHNPRQQGLLHSLAEGVRCPEAVLELAGQGCGASLLRAGARAAQRVVASSQTEAHGLLDDPRHVPELYEALTAENKLIGIANGLDAARWNPLTDPLLPSRFDPADLQGKARCKDALQLELDLPVRPEVPLLACMGNLSAQTGGALLARSAAALLRNDIQLVIVTDDADSLDELRALAAGAEERIRLLTGASDRAKHRAMAAADLLFVPARQPEQGDLHLCAQRYGTLPIVPKTSTMADAVVDCDAELITGTGFGFEDDASEPLATLQRALAAFAKRKAFDALRRRVMKLDVSWERSARRYEHLYKSIKEAQSL